MTQEGSAISDQGSHSAIVSQAGATPSTDTPIQRYRQAERAWWAHHGLAPTERFIQLAAPAVRLRVLEVGSGPLVLFVHGTAGAGPVWAPLVRELRGVRCLLLDRPGWGLSAPVDYTSHPYKTLVVDLLFQPKGATADAHPAQLVERYAARWQVEVCLRQTRQDAGGGSWTAAVEQGGAQGGSPVADLVAVPCGGDQAAVAQGQQVA
jgi:hypothetical protein